MSPVLIYAGLCLIVTRNIGGFLFLFGLGLPIALEF